MFIIIKRLQPNPGMEGLPELQTNDYDDRIPVVTTELK